MRICIIVAAAALTLSLAVAESANARGTISYDGTTMMFTGDGGADNVSVARSEGELAFVTSGLDAVPPQCTTDPYVDYLAYCPWPQRIVAQLGGGNDRFSVGGAPWDPFPANIVVEAHGGDGDDRLQSAQVQDGGAGNDKLEGHDGNQVLHGGPGDDEVSGLAGSDQVYGDEGNDTVSGDTHKSASPDVIDGGPGVDSIGQDWQDSAGAPLVITLAGGADDGRPGEGDDVRNVEHLKGFSAGRFVGTDGPDSFEVVQVTGPSDLSGLGGDDSLNASDGNDRLDGGAGADTLDGGFGDDTIIGGPGQDSISGDTPQGECGIYYCKLPSGNDTIDARDGERDSVTCGVGTDTVKADAVDTVAPDCETVNGGSGPGPTAGPGGACVVPKLRSLTVKKAKARLHKAGCKAKVRRAASRRVKRGRVIRQSARAGKQLTAGAKVTVTISRGRR
jgi:Ca2+-binding RTX toxin-like protein